ncbi:hypothetical protein C8J56DRAFT_950290 [Mycena floridula]|nr:hypothetical protein C8J56DRAFT_963779 [Mycena floridula]KAJ7585287.1 hypothetical protein C8J56DRAFT_950290 [Mycena floridula]
MQSVQAQIQDALLGLVPLVLEAIFYGVYTVLFFHCMHILLKRENSELEKRRPHLTFMTALFGLATTHMVLMCILAFKFNHLELGYFSFSSPIGLVIKSSSAPRVAVNLAIVIKVMFFISNLLADAIVNCRCYFIWGKRKRIVVVPAFSYLCTIVSFPLQFSSNVVVANVGLIVFVCMTFVTNVLGVTLTAGRVWWITHQAKELLPKNAKKRYDTVVAILLESGVLYPVVLIVAAITFAAGGTISSRVFIGLMYQVVGISPTLLLVRVGLGVSHDTVECSVSVFRATEGKVGSGDTIMVRSNNSRLMEIRPRSVSGRVSTGYLEP